MTAGMLSCRFDVQLKKDLHSTLVVICQLDKCGGICGICCPCDFNWREDPGASQIQSTGQRSRVHTCLPHTTIFSRIGLSGISRVRWYNSSWDNRSIRLRGGKISIRLIYHRTLWWTVLDKKQSQSSWLVSPHHLNTFSLREWKLNSPPQYVIQGRETIFWFYKSFSAVFAWLNELNSGISVHLPVASADTKHKTLKHYWTWAGMPCRQTIRPKDHKLYFMFL
jgi:hypothetical protein